jgi:hypothetical protein
MIQAGRPTRHGRGGIVGGLILISPGVAALLGNVLPASGGLLFFGLGAAFLVARVVTGRYGYAVPSGLRGGGRGDGYGYRTSNTIRAVPGLASHAHVWSATSTGSGSAYRASGPGDVVRLSTRVARRRSAQEHPTSCAWRRSAIIGRRQIRLRSRFGQLPER